MSGGGEGAFMFELFCTELETNAALLTDGLLQLEKGPPAPGAVEPLMRAAHSLKGAARIIGLGAAVKVAHAMEDCFVAVQAGKLALTPASADLLLSGVDWLKAIPAAVDPATLVLPEAQAPEAERLAAAIAAIVTGGPAPAAAAPPPAAAKPEPAPCPARPAAGGGEGAFMFELFCTELETNAALLTDGLLQLEKGPPAPGAVEPLMRAAHSLKGAARIIGLTAAVKVAHAMEDCFVAVQAGKLALAPASADLLLSGVDWLKAIPAAVDPATLVLPEAQAPEAERLAAAIAAIVTGGPAPAPEGAPPPAAAPEAAPPRSPSPRPLQETERIVRVNAASMERSMGLSGELFVQAGRLEAISGELLRSKAASEVLAAGLEAAFQAGQSGDVSRAVELVLEAKQRNAQGARALSESLGDFDAVRRRLLATSGRLYHEILSGKMRPFSECTQGFARMVRDISRSVGKVVRLDMVGLSTGVDRDILEKLESPLTHLLRNAIDHGIESPERRINAGKPMEGAIRLEAWHAAGMLVIEISDDGAGVDMARLKDTILARKLTTAELVDKMSEPELLDFIFLPGFSTRRDVSELSGRGVGLDIVQSMLREVGGTVRMDSRAGQGTFFRLRLPLTLSVIKAIIVEVAGEPYAFPLSRISRCARLPREEIVVEGGRRRAPTEDGRLLLVGARELLDLPEPQAAPDASSVVIVGEEPSRYAVEVDRFLGEHPIVVRPLDQRLGKVRDISAAGVLDDGSAVLIFDVDDLVRSAELAVKSEEKHGARGPGAEGVRVRKRILVVDDSPTVREVQRQLLESAGYGVDLSVNGMDAWNAVRSAPYDIVISDIDMPRMNGLELVRKIRGDARFPGLPIIIVSYKDSPEDRAKGVEAGADLYLTKSSFQDETLLRAVHDLTSRGGA